MPSVSWLDVGLAWLAMLVPLYVASRRDRPFAKTWLLASGRAALQLAVLSLVLTFLFRRDDWRLTGLAFLVMLMAAARTALARARFGYRGMLRDCIVSMAVALFAAMIVVRLFGEGRVLIGRSASFLPFLGILLGNSLSGLSLGLTQWLRELKDRRAEIEFWLSIGACRSEALSRLKTSALRTAMTAIVNALTVAGLVSIPGMLTGQLLAGGEVGDAVRFQLCILFLVALVVFTATALCLYLAERGIFDVWDNFLPDALEERA